MSDTMTPGRLNRRCTICAVRCKGVTGLCTVHYRAQRVAQAIGKPGQAQHRAVHRAMQRAAVRPGVPDGSLAPWQSTEPWTVFLWAHGVGDRWTRPDRGERPALGFAPTACSYGRDARLPHVVRL